MTFVLQAPELRLQFNMTGWGLFKELPKIALGYPVGIEVRR